MLTPTRPPAFAPSLIPPHPGGCGTNIWAPRPSGTPRPPLPARPLLPRAWRPAHSDRHVSRPRLTAPMPRPMPRDQRHHAHRQQPPRPLPSHAASAPPLTGTRHALYHHVIHFPRPHQRPPPPLSSRGTTPRPPLSAAPPRPRAGALRRALELTLPRRPACGDARWWRPPSERFRRALRRSATAPAEEGAACR